MGQKKTSNKSVLGDVSNLKHSITDLAGHQGSVKETKGQKGLLKATESASEPIVTFTRKTKASSLL